MQLLLKEYFTASVVIIRILLITQRGIRFTSDDGLSWRAPATQHRWPLSWPQSSCSDPKHLRPQRVKQTEPDRLKMKSKNAISWVYKRETITGRGPHRPGSQVSKVEYVIYIFITFNEDICMGKWCNDVMIHPPNHLPIYPSSTCPKRTVTC